MSDIVFTAALQNQVTQSKLPMQSQILPRAVLVSEILWQSQFGETDC